MITPNENQPKLAEAINIPSLYFKREDLHPLGSHKGRSIPYMIDSYLREGFDHFAISSSGNAAKAAALHIKKHNQTNDKKISLDIFTGRKINPQKLQSLKELEDQHIIIEQTERPLQKLFQILKNSKIKSLRQSQDEKALEGYKELAHEISDIPSLQAIFIPTSSGTLAEALGKEFKEMKMPVQIHIVQTSYCHPIAETLDQGIKEGSSIADAIVDMRATRKEKTLSLIKESKGSGWIASNQEILDTQSFVQKISEIQLSPNSILGIAGLIKSLKNGWKFDGAVACIITGK